MKEDRRFLCPNFIFIFRCFEKNNNLIFGNFLLFGIRDINYHHI